MVPPVVSSARVALRHSQLCRCRAFAGIGGLPGDRPVCAWLWHDAFSFDATFRNGQQAAVAVDVIDLMDALKIQKAILAGYDWGARTADIVAALWPERCKALVSVSGYLIGSPEANKMPLPPKAEYQWWYQYYFATERGVLGYDKYRHDFGKLIWQIASPKWDFDDATFDRTAASFNNPDYVAIVIHNYRWRLGLAEGEPKYDDLEKRLAEGPVITVPTITLEGDANGAPHPGRHFLSQQVLRQICAPGRPRPCRAQSASGSPSGIRPGGGRCGLLLIGASGCPWITMRVNTPCHHHHHRRDPPPVSGCVAVVFCGTDMNPSGGAHAEAG